MPRIMKLHRYIDHDSQMTPIDFQVTRSKVKVAVTRNKIRKFMMDANTRIFECFDTVAGLALSNVPG
ncbi:hypothetical protein DPMN_097499 [Dreissena polymorpha]|uniref:Uncharacterized protein n=1 Tax=Dreissena polymorpha TaxID=45954 RepID=A0A9D4R4T0_DREPO|nr:hypothetical protein DPMN_097499 [Dreissena polymorpha]